MKSVQKMALPLAFLLLASGCKQGSEGLPRAAEVPESDLQKRSYALGQNVSNGLKAANIEFDSAYFNAGFYDAIDDEKRMTDEEMQAALTELQAETQQKQVLKQEEERARNLDEGNTYLAKNAEQEGIVVTDSGLQYKITTEGDGKSPTASDTVTVHYEGRLTDGTVFDSSLERGEPATFPVNGVIPGWTEALQLMSVGSKWELTIPSELAYGERGAGGKISPNAVLVFDVELLGIQEVEAAE